MILLLRVHAPLVLILVIVLLGKPYAIHGFGSSFPSQINPLTYDTTTILRSSFYEDFDINDDEDDDDDDDDDDNDNDYEYEEIDQRSIADFKSKMSKLMDDQKEAESTTIGSKSDNVRLEDGSGTIGSVDELIEFARKQQQEEKSRGTGSGGTDEKEKETIVDDWAKPVNEIRPGTVLIANPRKFCEEGDFGDSGGDSAATINEKTGIGKSFFGGLGLSSVPAPSLLSKFGLTQPPPRTLGADRQADLLPVVIVVNNDGGQIQGVLLNRRTGYLLGDLEQPASGDDSSNSNNDDMTPILEKFCIQPLWFGGIEQKSVGLDMLHLCPAVNNAKRITEDGMYWGGDPTQAQDAMEDPSLDRIYSGFDFKFFVQSTTWASNSVLQNEVDDKIWFPANVSRNVLFKSRDRMGTKKAKPLWTEIMNLLGDEYSDITKSFYATD